MDAKKHKNLIYVAILIILRELKKKTYKRKKQIRLSTRKKIVVL